MGALGRVKWLASVDFAKMTCCICLFAANCLGPTHYNIVSLGSWIRRVILRRRQVRRLAAWDRRHPSDSLRLPNGPAGYRSSRETFGPTAARPRRRFGRFRAQLASAGRSDLQLASDSIGLLPIAGDGAGRSRPGSLSPGFRRGLADWHHARRASRWNRPILCRRRRCLRDRRVRERSVRAVPVEPVPRTRVRRLYRRENGEGQFGRFLVGRRWRRSSALTVGGVGVPA